MTTEPDPIPQADRRRHTRPPLISKRFLVILAYALIGFAVWMAAALGAGDGHFPRWVRRVLTLLALSPVLAVALYKVLELLSILLEAAVGTAKLIKPLSHRTKTIGAIVISVLIVAFGADKFWRHFESRQGNDHTVDASPLQPRDAVPSPTTEAAPDVVKLAPSTNPAADLNRMINNSPIILPAPGLTTQPAQSK